MSTVYLSPKVWRKPADKRVYHYKSCRRVTDAYNAVDQQTAERRGATMCKWCDPDVDNTPENRQKSLRWQLHNGEI